MPSTGFELRLFRPAYRGKCDTQQRTFSMTRPETHICIQGFPSLAAFIASDRDRSTLIYKRFDRLAARNLLILQSELAELQSRLDAYDQSDWKQYQQGGPAALPLENLQDWGSYKAAYGPETDRMKLLVDIKRVLREYSERSQRLRTHISPRLFSSRLTKPKGRHRYSRAHWQLSHHRM